MIKKIKRKISHAHKNGKLKRAQRSEAIMRAHSEPSAFDEAVIEWTAPEYVKHDKGLTWTASMVLLVIISAGIGLYLKAWTFSLVIIVFAVVYYLIHLEHPRNIDVVLSDIGIKIGQKKFSYSKIKAFWIIYEPPFIGTLVIRVNTGLMSELTIQLGPQDPVPVREFLLTKIPEMEGKTESLTDALLRLFRI